MKKKPRDKSVLLRLFLIAWAAVGLHIFADYWNDYGIHPFAPFSNRWFYGDFIFIVEPALWLAMLPFVWFTFRWRWAKVGSIALAVLAGGVALFGPQGGIGTFILLALWGTAVYFAEDRLGHDYPLGTIPAVAALLVLFVFRVGLAAARWEVRSNLEEQLKGETVLQTVLSPFPGNPFQWRAIVATSGPGYTYIVRLGTVSIIPGISSPLAEYYGIRTERMAPMEKPTVSSERAVNWIGEFRSTTTEYAKLALQSCDFENFIKFSRVPFWIVEPGRFAVAGDLRYDHEKGMGFAKVALDTSNTIGAQCPEYDAPWEPPISFASTSQSK
jgi:inner membrane protein